MPTLVRDLFHRLIEPIFEARLAESRIVVRNQRPFGHFNTVVARVQVRDYLAWILPRRQVPADDFKETVGTSPRRICICLSYTENMAERADPLSECTGFDWDEGNASKNWQQHRVKTDEAEDLFFNEPLVVRGAIHHYRQERRFYTLGHTAADRLLFAAFTIRGSLIRIISVRDMNSRERELYGHHQNKN